MQTSNRGWKRIVKITAFPRFIAIDTIPGRTDMRGTLVTWRGQCLGIVDDQVMAVVGGDDQDRVVPVAVGLDPADDGADGLLAAVDGADGVVEVVGVEREVDVAGLDEEGERLVGLGRPGRSERPRSCGPGSGARAGRPGCTSRPGAACRAVKAGRGVVAAVGGPVGEMIEPVASRRSRTGAPTAPRRQGGGRLQRLAAVDTRLGVHHDVFAAVLDVDRRQVGVGDEQVAGHAVPALGLPVTWDWSTTPKPVPDDDVEARDAAAPCRASWMIPGRPSMSRARSW